jgi:GAF domain-containing protein
MPPPLPPEPPNSPPEPAGGAEPLVPILRVEQALTDPVALATWHEALSDSLGMDVPHDLLGLWLFPAEGGVVLLGPAALAEDDLQVPCPAPQLERRQLAVLEEIVGDAGYRSVTCLPIRFGRRDVGLMLVADLQPGRHGESEVVTLTSVSRRLAPALGRMARQWHAVHGPAGDRWQRIAGLVDALAEAAAQATTPQRYVAALSRALEPLLPHDQLELLVADSTMARHYRLTEHAGGPLWADPSLILGRDLLEPAALLDHEGRLLLPDACRDPRWPRGYFTAAEPAGAELRAVVGSRFGGPGGLVGYLLAGSVGPDLYEGDDAALLARVGKLIGAQVAAWAASGAVPARSAREEAVPALLLEVAETLAMAGEPSEATRRVAEIAERILPFDQMRFALRLTEGDRVVLLGPGERRLLPDLPLVPVAGTPLALVLKGELPAAFDLVEGEAHLVVPLRVAGRVHGALVFSALPPAVLNPAHTRVAQHLADVVAPHLELLRRAALLPPPFRPGWKREPRS